MSHPPPVCTKVVIYCTDNRTDGVMSMGLAEAFHGKSALNIYVCSSGSAGRVSSLGPKSSPGALWHWFACLCVVMMSSCGACKEKKICCLDVFAPLSVFIFPRFASWYVLRWWLESVCEVLLSHLAAVCFISLVVLARSAVVIPPTQLACIVGLCGRYYERCMARPLRDPSRLSWPWGSAPSGSGGPSSAVGLTSLTHC